MKTRTLQIALLGAVFGWLLAGSAQAQTYPTCLQLPLLGCVAGDDWTGVHNFGGATSVEIPNTVVGSLPAAGTTGRIAQVTDGSTATDCTTGGGANINVCHDNGSAWVIVGDGTGGAGVWTDDGTVVFITTATTDDLALGNTALVNSSKFSIDGDADQVQFTAQGFSTQTDSIIIVETSAGTEVFNVDASGDVLMQSFQDIDGPGTAFEMNGAGSLTMAGDLTVSGGDITLGATGIFSGGDTASLDNLDAIDATTEATLETALDIAGDVTGTGLGSVTLAADVVAAAEMADADHGDVVWSGGVATVENLQCTDCVEPTDIGDDDFGDWTCTAGDSCTLDADVVAPAEIADADFGDFTCASGVCSLDPGALDSVMVWNENVCLTADCVGADDPCDCCTGAGAGCSASTFTLAATPRADCDAFGAGGTIQAWSNGIMQKCVASAPGVNEFALATNVITPNANSSVMFVTYEQ